MDEKLQQIFKIKPLQTTVIAFRTTEEYRKMMKKTCVAEMKNLVNVEMTIEQVELKMPKEQQIPPIPTEEIRKTRVGSLLRECSLVEEGIHFL